MQRTAKRPPNKPLLHNETAHAAARVGSRPRRSRSLPSSVAQARCCSALWQRPGPEPGWQHMDMALARERWSCSRHSSSGGSGRESVGDEEPHRFAGAGGRDRSGVRRRHGIGHPKRRTGRGPARLLYLGTERSAEELTRRLLRAAGIGLVVSASFVILFGAAGLVVAATTSGVVRYFPWIGLVVGVLLVAAGAATLGGVSPQLGILDRLGDRAGAIAQGGGIAGYAAYGLAYAAGSLGCTRPIFLGVVAAGNDDTRSRWRGAPIRPLWLGYGFRAVGAHTGCGCGRARRRPQGPAPRRLPAAGGRCRAHACRRLRRLLLAQRGWDRFSDRLNFRASLRPSLGSIPDQVQAQVESAHSRSPSPSRHSVCAGGNHPARATLVLLLYEDRVPAVSLRELAARAQDQRDPFHMPSRR